jgi:hypothetical protein
MSAFNKNLLASTFSETYRYTRSHGVQFHEELSFSLAWNNSQAYAAAGNAGLTLPISESFSLDSTRWIPSSTACPLLIRRIPSSSPWT